jgi:hypothetical protein
LLIDYWEGGYFRKGGVKSEPQISGVSMDNGHINLSGEECC